MTVEINIIGKISHRKRAEIKAWKAQCALPDLALDLVNCGGRGRFYNCARLLAHLWVIKLSHCIHKYTVLTPSVTKLIIQSLSTTSNKTLALHINNKEQTYKMNKVLGIDPSVTGGVLRKNLFVPGLWCSLFLPGIVSFIWLLPKVILVAPNKARQLAIAFLNAWFPALVKQWLAQNINKQTKWRTVSHIREKTGIQYFVVEGRGGWGHNDSGIWLIWMILSSSSVR